METIAAPNPPSGPTPLPGPSTITPQPIGGTPKPAAQLEDLGDPFAKYGPAGDKPADKPPEPKEKPAEPKGKPDAKATPKDKLPPDPKPPEKPADPKEGKVDDKAAPPKKAHGWSMYREEQKKTEALTRELTELKAKLSGPPKDFKIDEHPEFKTVKERLTAEEKRRQELEDTIRFVDYEKSAEYQEKYHKPYVAAWRQGLENFTSLPVPTEDGNTRPATPKEFESIITATSSGEALRRATELLKDPATAAYAGQLRDRVMDAWRKAEDAKKEFREKGSERFKTEAELRSKEDAERAERFETVANEAVEKYPHWFKPEEGDDEGNGYLETGFMLANAAFGGQIKDPQTNQMRDPTPEEMVLIHAQMRNKAAGFDRLAYKHARLSKRVEELEAELAEYRESDPPKGEATSAEKGTDDDDDPFKKFEK